MESKMVIYNNLDMKIIPLIRSAMLFIIIGTIFFAGIQLGLFPHESIHITEKATSEAFGQVSIMISNIIPD